MKEQRTTPKLRFKGFSDPWEQRDVKNTFKFLKNNTFSRALLNYKNGNFKNIHYGDVLIKFGDIINASDNNVPFVNSNSDNKIQDQTLQNGDVIVADTAEDNTVGKVTEIQGIGEYKVVSGLHTIPLRPFNKFAPGFLGHYLNSNSYHNQLMRLMQGIKVLSISKSSIQNTIIKYPDIEEQSKISELISNIDSTIALHEEKLDKLNALKKAMLQKMFPNKGQNIPEIRFKGFTDAWEQRKVSELGEIITGSTPSTSHSEYYSEDGIPWVTPTDIHDNTISDTTRKLSLEGQKVGRVVPADTILVTCIASIGKNTMLTTKGSFNQQINGLVPDKVNYYPYFLLTESVVWSKKMKSEAAAGTMQIVNRTDFSSIKTMVPSLPEQRRIGDYFKSLDDLITLHQRKLDKFRNIKKFLLQNMFI